MNRRSLMKSATGAYALHAASGRRAVANQAAPGKAKVVISLDLEMSREFPTRDQMHWDFEKGNLDGPTKAYAVKAARLVKDHGGRIHFFALGRTMEQADIAWLQGIVDDGHLVGNHTYDHVNLLATRAEDLQFRFARAPWLLEGRGVADEIRRNVQLAESAFTTRLKGRDRRGGFRTPGGFHSGLKGREDLQRLLLDLGYTYVSSLYPAHAYSKPDERPNEEIFRSIEDAQALAQPFAYPTGLIEIPMSPISDVGALRTCRWPLADFTEAIRRGLSRVIEQGGVFDFLAHPSCLGVVDPNLETIAMILDTVAANAQRAEIVTLDKVAEDFARKE